MRDLYISIPNESLNLPGYEEKTTFMSDFAIADVFGESAVKDTYKRAFNEWKEEVEYLTELVLVLNTRCWLHFNKGNKKLSELYAELYHATDQYAYKTLEGEDLEYYFRTTD